MWVWTITSGDMVSQGLSPHLQQICGCAELAQGQNCLGKEGQEVEIRVDMQGSDCLGRNWHLAFVFGHYLLGMKVGKPVVKSLSVPVTVGDAVLAVLHEDL